jgi:hypothetical protein
MSSTKDKSVEFLTKEKMIIVRALSTYVTDQIKNEDYENATETSVLITEIIHSIEVSE